MRINDESPPVTALPTRRTQARGVQSAQAEDPTQGESFPVCPALHQHHIFNLGIQAGDGPMKIVRPDHPATCFLAACSGSGRMRIGQRWHRCEAGFAGLVPALADCEFESLPGSAWEFCFVGYNPSLDRRFGPDLKRPRLGRFDPLPLRSAIIGLLHEFNGPGQPNLVQTWTDLIHEYVARFVQTETQVDQLRLLWERVANHLSGRWNLAQLAREAGYSGEHLRRLCHARLGRSPMQQVSHLRMRRASELLTTTDLTIESIAREVGYENPFVFSNAFTKRIGWRPSAFRQKRPGSQPGSLLAA